MALSERSFVRLAQTPIGNTAGNPTARMADLWFYATDDAASVVETAGYFNALRSRLVVGDLILCIFAAGGTSASKMLRVVTVPATGNVTVGQSSVTAG